MITTSNLSRLRCTGYIKRIDENQLARRIIKYKPKGVGSKGRPELRYMDEWDG